MFASEGGGVRDPVVGEALRAIRNGDRSVLAESEGLKCPPHRRVVLVGVAAQVIGGGGREAENHPRDPVPTRRSDAVNDVVVDIGVPGAVDLGIGLVGTPSKGENGEWTGIIGHEKTVSTRDVFFRINAVWVSFGPLGCVPIFLYKRAGMVIRDLDEIEVADRSDPNLYAMILCAIVLKLQCSEYGGD